MAKITINVMPKPVLLDPQGKAVLQALARIGAEDFTDVRVGKALELTVKGEVSAELLEEAERLAKQLFINTELEYVHSVTSEGA